MKVGLAICEEAFFLGSLSANWLCAIAFKDRAVQQKANRFRLTFQLVASIACICLLVRA